MLTRYKQNQGEKGEGEMDDGRRWTHRSYHALFRENDFSNKLLHVEARKRQGTAGFLYRPQTLTKIDDIRYKLEQDRPIWIRVKIRRLRYLCRNYRSQLRYVGNTLGRRTQCRSWAGNGRFELCGQYAGRTQGIRNGKFEFPQGEYKGRNPLAG